MMPHLILIQLYSQFMEVARHYDNGDSYYEITKYYQAHLQFSKPCRSTKFVDLELIDDSILVVYLIKLISFFISFEKKKLAKTV